MLVTLNSYIPEIQWNKVKDAITKSAIFQIPAIVGGSLLTRTDPRAVAIYFLSHQIFSRYATAPTWRKLDKLPAEVNPFNKVGTKGVIAISFFAGQIFATQVGNYLGYPTGYGSQVIGFGVGAASVLWHISNQTSIDPFKESRIVDITEANFEQEIKQSTLPVVVDAYATWCPPCKALAPIVIKLAEELEGKVKFVKFNIDTNQELAKKLEISAVPTLLFYRNGELVKNHTGFLGRDQLVATIEQHQHQSGEIINGTKS